MAFFFEKPLVFDQLMYDICSPQSVREVPDSTSTKPWIDKPISVCFIGGGSHVSIAI